MFDSKIDRPSFQAPAMACDAHFHIFGEPERYTYEKTLRYVPPVATAEDYEEFRKLVGIDRMVLVQPSCFGKNNRCQLDAAAKFGLDRCRVIVDLEDDCTDQELEELSKQGAKGIRINVRPIEPLTAGLADSLLPRIRLWEKRCQEIGWTMDFLFPDWLTTEMIPHLRKLRVPFTIAHMGMNKGCNGISSEGFQALKNLVANEDGFCWIKLTAAYRISNQSGYEDVIPMAQSLIEAAPNRILWGSDFPHASFTQHNTVKLFNLLQSIEPSEEGRKQILVTNPAHLYGFSLGE